MRTSPLQFVKDFKCQMENLDAHELENYKLVLTHERTLPLYFVQRTEFLTERE